VLGSNQYFGPLPTKTPEFEVKKRGRSKSRTFGIVNFIHFRWW